jgi:cellulose synthase/poly-beta-1,6-N-acetylglucosamine synthase-like glycosyltransferase
MIESFLWFACTLYAIEYTFFLFGQRRIPRLPRSARATYPQLTILVAARNEARNIRRCLEALLAQDYPDDRLQIIAVDDDSDDATRAIMHEVSDRHRNRVTVVATHEEHSHARGKARAIAQGIDHATGEIILLTDADCVAPPTWARGAVEHFVDGVDAFGGFTVIRSSDYFSAVQQLDWIHLQSLAAGGLAFNVPLGVIGNNFGFRREAYEQVGGYRSVGFSVTEDFALFRAMHRRGRRVVFPCTRDTEMLTLPCASLADVLSQKQRWSRGGMETGVRGWAVLIIAVFMMAALLIAPFVSPIAWVGVWSTKFTFDLAVMTPTLKRLGRLSSLRYFLLFQFYFVAQALVVPFLLMNRTVVWKGRAYRS